MKKLKNNIVITTMVPPNCTKEANLCASLCDGKLVEVMVEVPENHSYLGNIYVGKVQNIVKNINAAFIEFDKNQVGYYPLEELSTAIFTKKQGRKKLAVGDELLVQVSKDPIKTKAAVLTSNLNFAGRNFVFTTGKKGIGLSSKLTAEQKENLKSLVQQYGNPEYGIIVRTNASQTEKNQLIEELVSMNEYVTQTMKNALYRTTFSMISQRQSSFISFVKNAYASEMTEIVTDNKLIFDELHEYLSVYQPIDLCRLRFYEDKLLPLKKLYNLELQLERALSPHVWLKSGAYLYIEPTEACTVIDVNTGKCEGKKTKQDTFLNINIEAAREITRQMRLRNLTGIILIDFINMEREEDKQTLMEQFSRMVKNDHIKTVVVDMTKLGIVEVTRKKESCTLAESIQKCV